MFRNTLYEEISRKSPQLRPQQATTAIQPIHLFHQPDSTFDFIRDDRPREIVMSAHAGAINAYQSGNYRLCLVAFGMALEAILIAWLEQHSLAERKAAVAAARAKPNVTLTFRGPHELENDPTTWRLVNLTTVAKELSGGRGPIDLPAALRDWRNYVHPKVVLANYLPERQLEPDARAASGILATVLRDIP